MRRLTLVPALCAAASLAACATAPAPDPWSGVSAAIEQARATTGFPAVSAAIVRDGRIVYERGFGLANAETNTAARADSVFRLASVSKPITATAVMQLVEAGRIGLDSSIRDHVPSLPSSYAKVTVADLLRHTGGVRHYKEESEYITTRRCAKLSEALQIFAGDPLDHAPGEKVTYSTWGYTLLGLAIEKASGLSYPDYIQRHILTPSGMASTRVDTLALVPQRVAGYTSAQGGGIRNADLLDTSCRIPAGGWISTVGDLARFAIALDAGKLLKPETVREMMRPQVSEAAVQRTIAGMELPAGFRFPALGFGWVSEDKGAGLRVQHGGNQPGTTSMLYLTPDRRMAVALLTNLDGKGIEITALAEAISVAAAAERPPR